MALPKKKRRPSEIPKAGAGSSAPVVEETLKGSASVGEGSPAANDQMEKAFEIMDSIEQTHPLPDIPAAGRSSLGQPDEAKDPEQVRIRFSLQPPDAEQRNDTAVPVISLKLKIPSFLWKVPVISGVTRNIIRKLSQE
jgi:hypothetical protein